MPRAKIYTGAVVGLALSLNLVAATAAAVAGTASEAHSPAIVFAPDVHWMGVPCQRIAVRGTDAVLLPAPKASSGASRTTVLLNELGECLSTISSRPGARGAAPTQVRVEADGGEEAGAARASILEGLPAGAHSFDASGTAVPTVTWISSNGSSTAISTSGAALELTIAADRVPLVSGRDQGQNGGSGSGAPSTSSEQPLAFAFHPIGPNPIQGQTQLRFQLPGASRVSIRVFDLAGRSVAKVTDQQFAAGAHSVAFEPKALTSGRYFVRLTVHDSAGRTSRMATQSVVILR